MCEVHFFHKPQDGRERVLGLSHCVVCVCVCDESVTDLTGPLVYTWSDETECVKVLFFCFAFI